MSVLKGRDVKKSFVQRLQQAKKSWDKLVEAPLAHRNKMLYNWIAGYTSTGGEKNPHTLNLIDRGIGIVVPYLAMSNPKTMISTEILRLRPSAYTTQLAMNHLLDEIKFSRYTLRPAIFNSMFGSGIVKSGIVRNKQVEIEGYLHDLGQPYSDVVDDSDYIGDVTARNRESFEMEGNIYYMPTEYAKEFFGKKHSDSIRPNYKLEDRSPEQIVKGGVAQSDYQALRNYTKFVDLWIPDEEIIVTIMPEGYERILRTVEWDGPEGGPYDVLGYKWFPKYSIPKPPVWGWMPFDTAINLLINKMRKQAEREKSFLAYEGSIADEVADIATIEDGGTRRVSNIGAMKEIQLGGVNPENYNWVGYLENQASKTGGNWDVAGGRDVMSKTLGQEQMLMSNATRIIDDMVSQVYEFATSIMRKQAWYLWTDPLIQIPQIKRIPGVGSIEVMFDQAAKEGDFWDYSFNIEPHSMQRFNSEMEYQKMLSYLGQFVFPVAGLAAQQGMQLDVNVMHEDLSRYLGLRGTKGWFKSAVPSGVEMNPYQPQMGTVQKGKNKDISDGRTGAGGAASRNANLRQQQQSAYQKSSRG